MNREGLENIFDSKYKRDQESLELAMLEMRNFGASQFDTVSILRDKLCISLREADSIVLNSPVWRDRKNENLVLRKSFDNSFKQVSKKDESKLYHEILLDTDKSKPTFIQRLLSKLKFW